MTVSKLFIWSLATYSPRLQPGHCASLDRFKLIHANREACWSYPTGSRLRTVEDWRLIAEHCQRCVAHAYLWLISAALSPLIRMMNLVDGPRNDPWGIAALSHRQASAPVSTPLNEWKHPLNNNVFKSQCAHLVQYRPMLLSSWSNALCPIHTIDANKTRQNRLVLSAVWIGF